MNPTPPTGPFCQSCGMPLREPADFGTNADGSRSNLYCGFCFRGGSFTDPGITMNEMIDKVAGFLAQMQNMPPGQAKEIAHSFIPQLERWRSK